MKETYRPPRIDIGDLRTWVTFFVFAPNKGPEPGEKKKKEVYGTFSKVDEVWSKDLEQAKANGTLSDITITIRDTHGEYVPSNKHYLEVDLEEYEGKQYNIKHTQPDPQNRDFVKIIAGMVDG